MYITKINLNMTFEMIESYSPTVDLLLLNTVILIWKLVCQKLLIQIRNTIYYKLLVAYILLLNFF